MPVAKINQSPTATKFTVIEVNDFVAKLDSMKKLIASANKAVLTPALIAEFKEAISAFMLKFSTSSESQQKQLAPVKGRAEAVAVVLAKKMEDEPIDRPIFRVLYYNDLCGDACTQVEIYTWGTHPVNAQGIPISTNMKNGYRVEVYQYISSEAVLINTLYNQFPDAVSARLAQNLFNRPSTLFNKKVVDIGADSYIKVGKNIGSFDYECPSVASIIFNLWLSINQHYDIVRQTLSPLGINTITNAFNTTILIPWRKCSITISIININIPQLDDNNNIIPIALQQTMAASPLFKFPKSLINLNS